MKKRSDPSGDWDGLRARIIGLGERSTRKSYYPELEQRLVELERFRALLDQSNDLIFLLQSPSGHFADVNETACRHLSLSREAILGMSIGDLVPHSIVETITALSAEQDGMDEGGTTIVTAFRSNGRELPVEMSVRPVAFKDAVYAVIVARDLSERNQAEEERQAHLRFFESMDRVNRAMQGTNDLEQVMKDVLDTLLAVFECDRAWLVYPCDPDAATWQVPMERTTPEYPSVVPIGVELPLDPVGAEVYRKLRSTEGPVKFGPDFQDQVPTVIAQAFHVQSFIAMAFYPKIGKPWSFGLHQCSYARAWTPEEERLFQEIGRRLSDTLSTLLAYRNLEESQKQIKQLINASPVAMIVSSGIEQRVESVNDKFIELFGYTIEDMPDVGHWWPFAYPDEKYREEIKSQWQTKVEQAIRNKDQIEPMEATVVCKDGLHCHIEFRLSSIGEKNLVTFVDLTERREVEEKLRTSEHKYREIFENVSDSLFLLEVTEDGHFRTMEVNRAFEKSTGFSRDQLLGKIIEETVPEETASIVNAKYRHCVEAGTVIDEEVELNLPTGLRAYHSSLIPIHDDNGRVYRIIGITRDITERKQAEAQLLASEQLFRALVENSPDFIARYDRECRRIYVNPAIQKLFGTSSKNMLGKTPADQSPVYTPQVFMDYLKRVIETGTESVTEMPFRTAQGEMHWSHMRFVPEFGPDGQVESVLHIGRDVHEIKENERRFRMLAENFPDFVIRFDRNGRYIYVNPAFEKALGILSESIIGKTPQELPLRSKPERNEAPLDLIRRAFDEGIANESEARWDTERGERIFETRYVPEKDAAGYIVTVLCIARDVTEQKRAEEELQKTNDLLRATIEAAPTAIIGLDLEGKVQHIWNPAAEKMLGWSAEEIMGKFLPSVPIDKEAEFQKFREWVRSGKIMDGVEVQRRRRDGTPIDYSIYGSPLHNPEGQITGNIAVLVDITERKRSEEQRKDHVRFLESMDKVNRAMQSANNLEWVMSDVLDLVLSIFDCDRAYLGYPCDPESPSWSLRAESTRPEYPGLLALGVDEVLIDAEAKETFRILLNTNGPATFGPGNSHPLPANATERFGLKSFMSMAFFPKVGKPWQFGIHQCSYARVWTSEDERLFHEIGRRLSDVLTVLLTYRQLQESEERYRQLVNLSPDAIAIFSQGRLVLANPAAVRIVGAKNEDDLLGRPILDFVDPDFQATVREQLERLNTGISTPFIEEKFLRLDGLNVDVEVAIISYQRESVDYMQIVARDITDRKHHELEREAIITVSQALRKATTRTEILTVILDQLIDLFQADGAVLVLPDPQTGGFIDEMGRGMVGERMIGLNIPPERGVANWVIKNKKPYLSNRADDDRLFYRPDLLGDSHCLAAVPLIAQEQAIGALWIARQVDILEQDLRLLNAIADIAANAIHRVILHEQTELQLHHLIALHQIDLAISANFDLNITLNVILKNVKDELEVDAASILLLDAVTHTLDYAAGIGFRTRRIEQSHVKLGNGCAGRAAQEYRTISYPDLNQAPGTFSRSSLLMNEEFLSHYATPLIVKGQVKGVLEIFHRKTFEAEQEWINYFETLATQAAIAIESTSLFENLQRSNLELMLAYDATIEGWSRALDLRDRETEGHTQRVTEMVLDLAEKMGISDAEKMDLRRGALLHDIGKMGVPDSILLKTGSLTESEWEVMRQHPFYAFQMLSPIPYLKHALDIPYCHHERWDGSGYPRGLRGEEIPLPARLFAVVDVFDALTSNRPYRASWSPEKVYRYIQEQAGKQFDPNIVKIFLEAGS